MMTFSEGIIDHLRYYAGEYRSYVSVLNCVTNRITGHSSRTPVPEKDRRKVWIKLRVALDVLIKKGTVVRHRKSSLSGSRKAVVRINEFFVKNCSIQ